MGGSGDVVRERLPRRNHRLVRDRDSEMSTAPIYDDTSFDRKKLGAVDRTWLARYSRVQAEKKARLGTRDYERCLDPDGHPCAVCGDPVTEDHPLHRVRTV